MRFPLTFNSWRRELSCDNTHGESGTTFVELLVVLAIMSLLAMVSIPYAEKAVQRHNEIELRRVLRETRSAIDAFHQDWKQQKFPHDSAEVSDNGYPVSLEVLVHGMDGNGAEGKVLRYLRVFPRNPFLNSSGLSVDNQWTMFGYEDRPDASNWNGEDVYDLRASSERIALDGSKIAEW